MSEEHPQYIPCCAGNNLHDECRVRRFGDLIEICGGREMVFTPEEATALAVQINRLATEIRNAANPTAGASSR